MEDSHVASLDVGDGVAVFGVFDGHGGMKDNLTPHIKDHTLYLDDT